MPAPCQVARHVPLLAPVLAALPCLKAGDKLDAMALELGDAGAAAFIALFKRRMGMPPEAFRQPARSTGKIRPLDRARRPAARLAFQLG